MVSYLNTMRTSPRSVFHTGINDNILLYVSSCGDDTSVSRLSMNTSYLMSPQFLIFVWNGYLVQ